MFRTPHFKAASKLQSFCPYLQAFKVDSVASILSIEGQIPCSSTCTMITMRHGSENEVLRSM